MKLLALSCLLLSGCASTQSYLDSTEPELVSGMGIPHKTMKLSSGESVWEYERCKDVFVPVGDIAVARRRCDIQSYKLKDGVVIEETEYRRR